MDFRFSSKEEYCDALTKIIDEDAVFDEDRELEYDELVEEYIAFCEEKKKNG